MEQITAVNMTVQIKRTFKDVIRGHSLLMWIFGNRAEVKQKQVKGNARE